MEQDQIKFKVNGKQYAVGSEVSSSVTLLDYLRQQAELRGTKYMCREGGCGACLVSAARPGAPAGAVNSCLVSITSCQDWEITTVEQVGNKLVGYHPLQQTLAKHNGTQCGYCSPGWIMAMYSLLKNKKSLTMLEIEQSFGSNVCRCTGYRPILDAFKQFASDAPKPNRLLDIEDLYICKKTGECDRTSCSDSDWCMISKEDVEKPRDLEIKLKDGRLWFKVNFIDDIFHILGMNGDDSYMLVAGNTAKGAYPIKSYPRILMDISSMKELKGYHLDQNLIIGAGSSLSETMDIFQHLSETEEEFCYLEKLRQHLLLVAHIPVRNLGTLAGNLMIKHQHNDFQSDVFLLLEAVGALITILDTYGKKDKVTPERFLKMKMKGKIIVNIIFPPLSTEYKLVTFKIMPRSQNAHAIVNAGFLYKMSPQNIVSEARVVYGGLSDNFVHAVATERYLVGKNLFSNTTLQAAVRILDGELAVQEYPLGPSAKYRKRIAVGLFYKGLLQLCPATQLHARYVTGATTLGQLRPVSSARQSFDTDPALWPLNQPVEKLDALIQCSGEASYTNDLPPFPHEVFGAFVLSTVALGDIVAIDASTALNQQGVLAFYSAKDLPGLNSYTVVPSLFCTANEEVFCSGSVKYHSQVIGVIAAETREAAESAAKLVNIKYSNVKKPEIDIKTAKDNKDKTTLFQEIDGTDKGKDIFKAIKGQQVLYGQYHFCMETLVCVTKPIEEGLEVYTSTQNIDGVQIMISRALKMAQHKIDVHVRRLGGAYGLKITRSTQVAVASALVAKKLNRPCRISMPLTTTMKAIGKRFPCAIDYEIAVDKSGKIQYVNQSMFHDNGYIFNEPVVYLGLDMYNNCYDKTRWNYKAFNSTTDTASNTWCRSPGNLEAVAAAEVIIERAAYEMCMDPIEFRLSNLSKDYADLRSMVETIKIDGEYDKRKAAVDKFNLENRWKKRALRPSFLRWKPIGYQLIDVNMAVYSDDGSVIINHGGIEMGQGLNTKAAQICAYFLKIPLEKIQIKGNNTIITPNVSLTGASLTSINVGIGVQRCCEELLKRLEPIRATLKKDATWEELIQAATAAFVDLQAHGYVTMTDTQAIEVLGVTLAEVEIDVLTGEWELLRVDILEDAGQSVSPEIDIGQVEGAFIMAMGYWTSEKLVYDPQTGEQLTNRTWNYYVPQARDIPQDLRVYLKKKSYSEPRLLGAKCISEPPMCMAVAVPFALRAAVAAARLDAGMPACEWFQIDGPFTREEIQLATATNFKEFRFN